MLNRYGLVDVNLLDLVEADKAQQDLTRQAAGGGHEEAFHLARNKARNGDDQGALDTIRPHMEKLDDDQRSHISSIANRRFDHLHAKHESNGHLSNEELIHLGNAFRHTTHLSSRSFRNETGNRSVRLNRSAPDPRRNSEYILHFQNNAFHSPNSDTPSFRNIEWHPNGQKSRENVIYHQNNQRHSPSPDVPAVHVRSWHPNGRQYSERFEHYHRGRHLDDPQS